MRETAGNTDVVIVGAGPSGLTLANVLADHGVDFRIVDRKSGPVQQSRAMIIHVRTLELLHRLGLAHRAVAQGVKTTHVEIYERGRKAAEFPLAGSGPEARTPFPYALTLGQHATEQLLVQRMTEHGRRVEWDTELLTLAGDADDVTATIRTPDALEETFSARWVVGADGASSRVRHAVNLRFAGKIYEQTGLLADVEMDLPMDARLDPGRLRLNLTRGGFVGMADLTGGRYRLFGAVPPGLAAATSRDEVSHEAYAQVNLNKIQQWFDDYFFVNARLTQATWTALYRIHSRVAEHFRVGNVFLIGDAAHIHSPAGGQGMNLGIGDAFNLGWKLAFVAKGLAHQRLLDSYEAERYPVAKAVLRGADRGFAFEATNNPVAEWLRANIGTRLVGPLMRLRTIRLLVYKLFSQTWISYHRSAAVAGKLSHRGGPRPGDRVPNLRLDSGARGIFTSLFDVIGDTQHHLILFEGPRAEAGQSADRQALTEVLDRYEITVPVHVAPTDKSGLQHRHVDDPCLWLVRPDGHIAYADAVARFDRLAAYMDGLYVHRQSGAVDRSAHAKDTGEGGS